MSVEELPSVDPYVQNDEEFAHIDILWLANLVDTLNSALQQIQSRLAAGGL
jgi:hypothetical protein